MEKRGVTVDDQSQPAAEKTATDAPASSSGEDLLSRASDTVMQAACGCGSQSPCGPPASKG